MGIDRPLPPEYRQLISQGPSLGSEGASDLPAPSPSTGTPSDASGGAVQGANTLDELERQLVASEAQPSRQQQPDQINTLDDLERALSEPAPGTDPISGQPTEPTAQPAQPAAAKSPELSAFGNYSAGMMKLISYGVGFPFDVAMDTVARVARQVGSDILNPETGMPYKPYDVGRSIEDGLIQAGVMQRADMDRLSAKFGYETAKGLLTSLGMVKIAEWASQLPNLRPFAQSVFDAIKAKPGVAVVSELGAGPGAVLGGNMTEDATSGVATGTGVGAVTGGMLGGKAGLPGKIAGGVVGAIAGGIGGAQLPGEVDKTMGSLAGGLTGGLVAGKTAQTIEGVGTKIYKGLTSPATPRAPGDAVYDPSDAAGNAARVKTFAQNQIDGALKQVDNEIEQVISALPVKMVQDPATGRMRVGNSEQVQRQVLKGFNDAEDIGHKMQTRFWNAVDPKAKVNQYDTNNELDRLSAESSADRFIRPELQRVREMFQVQDEDGAMRPLPTVGQVLKTAKLLQGLRQAEANVKIREPNQARIDNLATLEQILYKGLAGNFPSSIEAQQAWDFSQRLHSLFGYGQIADIRNALSTRGVPQGNAFEKLMAKPEGTKQAIQALDDLIAARVPSARTPAALTELTPNERAKLDGLRQSYEDSITTMFREAAEKEGPEAAGKFFEKNKQAIRPFANLYADLEYTTAHLANHLENRRLVETSAMARIVKEDPEKIVKWLFGTSPKDATAEAKKLVRQFSADPYAEEGFRNMVTREVFDRAKMQDGSIDPFKLRNQLEDPKQRRMIESVIGTDRMGRLDKMTDIAVRLERGDIQPLGQRVGEKFKAPFALAGAFTGRLINQMFGLKSTLQAPAMMSQMFKKAWLDYMRGGDPAEILANAVRDPRWERQLYAKEPVSTKELQGQVKLTRRLLGVEAGISDQMRRAYMNQLDQDDREGKAQGGATPQFGAAQVRPEFGNYANTLPPTDTYDMTGVADKPLFAQQLQAITEGAQGAGVNTRRFVDNMMKSPPSLNIEDRRRYDPTLREEGIERLKKLKDFDLSTGKAMDQTQNVSDSVRRTPYRFAETMSDEGPVPGDKFAMMLKKNPMEGPRRGESSGGAGSVKLRDATGEADRYDPKTAGGALPRIEDIKEGTNQRLFRFEAGGQQGVVKVEPNYRKEGDLFVHYMGAGPRTGGDRTITDKPWSVSSSTLMDVFKQLREHYPSMRTVTGHRISGARSTYRDPESGRDRTGFVTRDLWPERYD